MKTLKQEILEEFSLLEKQMITDLKKKIHLLNLENTFLKTDLINKEILIKSLNKNLLKN